MSKHLKEMTLIEHLEEFRTTLIRMLAVLILGCLLTYFFSDELSHLLLAPLKNALHGQGQVVYLSVFDKVIVQMQLAFWGGVIMVSPILFALLWQFVRPGLYEQEVRVIRPFMYSGFLLFVLGVIFAYMVVFPFTIEMLINFGNDEIEANISYGEYIVQSIKVLVLFGMLFQIPNALVILGFMELVTKQSLRKLRGYIYVGLTILAGIVTPPDVISQLVLLGPLIILYEIGILAVALIVHPYLHRKYA
jgi:sec-independent protein translocase protein TatC